MDHPESHTRSHPFLVLSYVIFTPSLYVILVKFREFFITCRVCGRGFVIIFTKLHTMAGSSKLLYPLLHVYSLKKIAFTATWNRLLLSSWRSTGCVTLTWRQCPLSTTVCTSTSAKQRYIGSVVVVRNSFSRQLNRVILRLTDCL